mmetsp:Transcript_109333/g.193636  ORF Transcript_109333/g.193636 Transcript_109333/m.193636 type:complete len:514 (+) Transcript_109333:90-1631(+)
MAAELGAPPEAVKKALHSDSGASSGCSESLPGAASATSSTRPPSSQRGAVAPGIDLESWRADLQRLHGTIDQVVQSFIASQTRQLDTVAAELASQTDRIATKERCFTELSDSIAGFVEEEAKRIEFWGVPFGDAEADARHEAYDADLPGPPALHRINRLWRQATHAFEAMKEAKERESAKVLTDERSRLEALVSAAEERCEAQRQEHLAEVATLRERLDALHGEGEQRGSEARELSTEVQSLAQRLAAGEAALAESEERLKQAAAARSRSEYEWDAEREELKRSCNAAEAQAVEQERAAENLRQHELKLSRECEERGQKLEEMKRIMDDQEREMTMKIDRVQQYVKERQAGALHAERKQQDAERLAERWQREVARLQADKDRLAALVLDLEGRSTGQAKNLQGFQEQHQQEVARLQDALRHKEEEMRNANIELLQRRDSEYQAKVNLERQREKDRSIALLKKKEQEVQIKDQQLKAARSRIQELESSHGVASSPSSRGRRGDGSLPPLPLSAR